MLTSDFKLALNGQIYDSEGLLYSYPEKITQIRATGQYPAWINALQSDSRFLRELVNPGGECFSVRFSQEGLFYSFTKYNPHDSRNGVVSISLYMLNKAVSDAKQLMNVLRNLMDYFLEKNSAIGIVDAEVESLLKDLSKPYSITLPTAEAASSLDAYRIYQTEEELQKLLYCAIQKEYSHYKWVHFISAASRKTVINPTLYSELNGQVKECYAINRGQWYELALSGTKYALKFSRPGYMQQEINFIVGQPSPYVEEGANHVINPKSPDEMGLRFKKKVTISLIDGSTNLPIVVGGNAVCITEELTENTSKVVELKANGYKSKTIALDSSKITKAEENIRETLQRDPRTYAPVQERQHYDWEDNNQEESNSKKKRIIYAIIIFIVGAVIGFCIPKFMSPRSSGEEASKLASKDATIMVLHDSIKKLNNQGADMQSQIKQLCLDTVNLNDKIKSLEIKLKNKIETAQNVAAAKEAEKNALAFLRTHDKWCLSQIKQASNDNNIYYKTVKTLLTEKNYDLNKVLAVLDPVKDGNDKWVEVVAKIEEKRLAGRTDDQIKDKIFEANTNSQRRENGTIDLNTIKNKLITLMK